MKTVYYSVKREKSDIVVTFWDSEQPKKVHEEKFMIVEPERLRFRFQNVLKLMGPFEMMDLSKKLD